MRILTTLIFMSCFGFAESTAAAVSNEIVQPREDAEIGHGGGCRKSSPPGKCCHMEKRTGKVHCH